MRGQLKKITFRFRHSAVGKQTFNPKKCGISRFQYHNYRNRESGNQTNPLSNIKRIENQKLQKKPTNLSKVKRLIFDTWKS